jgi:putative salt-induced outer membrane protein YdiY
MRLFRAVVCLLALSCPAVVFAQAAPPPPPPAHEEAFEASYVGVTGNASSNTFGLGADIIARPGAWLFRHKASFVRNESNELLTAKAFDYIARAERSINARTAAFGEYNFFRDRFAGVSQRNAVTGGLAFKAIDTAAQKLTLDVGLGYVNEKRLSAR